MERHGFLPERRRLSAIPPAHCSATERPPRPTGCTHRRPSERDLRTGHRWVYRRNGSRSVDRPIVAAILPRTPELSWPVHVGPVVDVQHPDDAVVLVDLVNQPVMTAASAPSAGLLASKRHPHSVGMPPQGPEGELHDRGSRWPVSPSPYLSRIERGQRPVDRRSLLEAIAVALRVAPSELAEQAFPPAVADPAMGEAQAAIIALEAALSDFDLGVPTGETARPWAAAVDHLNEAGVMADRIGGTGRGFGNMYFGPDNVGIWRVSIAVEFGEPGHARELAQLVNPARVPSAARQAMYWADLGRGMAMEQATRDQAVGALLRAEKIAPQRIRTNPFVRETVTDLIRRARREAVGRELGGMAYRMGLAPG